MVLIARYAPAAPDLVAVQAVDRRRSSPARPTIQKGKRKKKQRKNKNKKMKIVRRDFVSGRARADHFCHGKKSSTVAFGCDVSLFLLLPRLTVTFQAEKETNRVNWRPRMGSPAASRKVLHPFFWGSFAFFNRISFSSGRSFFPNVFPATSCRRGRVATRWGHYANTIQQRNPVNPADTL